MYIEMDPFLLKKVTFAKARGAHACWLQLKVEVGLEFESRVVKISEE